MAQAPRTIGATSAAGIGSAGIGADAKTRFLPRASRCSTLDTMPIISSYASLAVSPNVNSPCFRSTSPRTSWLGLVNLGSRFGEVEPGHDVRHDPDPASEQVAAQRLAVRLVGQAQHRGRVGVVDELVRQEGVQQRFHRGSGGAAVEQVLPLEVDHVLVGQPVEPPQPPQRIEPDRRQARRLDLRHVPPAALDAKHLDLGAEQVGRDRLDRGVAAPVQNQLRVRAEQPRRVDPERHVGVVALTGVVVHHAASVYLRPSAVHPPSSMRQSCTANCAPCAGALSRRPGRRGAPTAESPEVADRGCARLRTLCGLRSDGTGYSRPNQVVGELWSECRPVLHD